MDAEGDNVAVAAPKFEAWDLARHVSECPGGNVEYVIRMLFDMWRMAKHDSHENLIYLGGLNSKEAKSLREAADNNVAGWRESVLKTLEQLGEHRGGTLDASGSGTGR